MWYDKSALLSHNRLLNMVLSNRGGGKTFHFTRWAIEDFKKTGKQTVWVRRYKTELTDPEKGILVNGRFFDAVRSYYPDDDLTIEGSTGYINGEPAIIFIALSTSRQMKSVALPFTNKIIFDEFLVTEGRTGYLKAEVEVFLDLFETVARLRDNVRAVLLANAISIVNPYFLYFNIKPRADKRFTVRGQVCIEMFTDADFIEAKRKTRFGELVQNTRYGSYAIDNRWLLDSDTFIEPKPAKCEFMLGLKYNGIMYGFWMDYKRGLIFVNRQYDPSSYWLYCLNRDDHDMNLMLIKSLSDSHKIKKIVTAFRCACLRFEDMSIKDQFYELIGLFVR